MSDIPAFPYERLWHERGIGSVANLTRRDGEEFIALAARIPGEDERRRRIRWPMPTTRCATCAAGSLTGAAVLVVP